MFQIGLMRNGILLAEDSPENIMRAFGTATLEDAFLILSQKQGQSEEADNTLQNMITTAAESSANSIVAATTTSANTVTSATAAIVPAVDATAAAVPATEQAHSMPKLDVEYLAGQERYLRRNMSFAESKPPGFLSKLRFTSSIRMKALLLKNVLQLIRQPS